MFNISQKTIQWGGKELILETGKIARQADGAILVKMGQTEVLCTIVAEKIPRAEMDFLPLTVNYQKEILFLGSNSGWILQTRRPPK